MDACDVATSLGAEEDKGKEIVWETWQTWQLVISWIMMITSGVKILWRVTVEVEDDNPNANTAVQRKLVGELTKQIGGA